MFYEFLLKQKNIRKKQINKNITKFDNNNNKTYKVSAIKNNVVYIKKSKIENLLKFYYLII